jgi:hypothetical protein
MRAYGTLLFVVSALTAVAAGPRPVTALHFDSDCTDVTEAASTYLKIHGMFTHENKGMMNSAGLAFSSLSVRAGGFRGADGSTPWTDAQGNKISDFGVYWRYADKKETEKIPFGVWRLRLDHYRLQGELKLVPDEKRQETCTLDFNLHFVAGGANMVGILGVDSQWSYGSNGRMEQEYLKGISSEIERRKAATTK